MIPYEGAQRVGVTVNRISRKRELTIFYPTSSNDTPQMMRRALEILELYTSSKNKTKAQRFVVDPIASGDTYWGTWRLVNTRMNIKGEEPGIFQTLREGWAVTLSDAEIRIVDTLESPMTGTSGFTQMWPNIDPKKLQSLSAGLLGTTLVTNPKTEENQAVSGKYAVSQIRGLRQEEDGAGAILRNLTKVTSITDVTGLAAANKTTDDKNEILQVFNLQTGEGDWKMCVWFNLDPTTATRTVCQSTITDADLVSNFAAGYTYASRQFKDVPENGTASFFVLFRKVAWNAWGHDSYAHDILDHPRNAGTANVREFITKKWLNIQDANQVTAEDDVRKGVNATVTDGYVIIGATLSSNGNGSFSITQTQKKVVAGETPDIALLLSAHGLKPGLKAISITLWENYVAGTLPSGTAPTVDGAVVKNEKRLQADGLWGRIQISETTTWAERWATDNILMSKSSVGGYRLRENNQARGISEDNRDTDFTAAQTPSDPATRNVIMAQMVESADGERIIRNQEGVVSVVTTSVSAEVQMERAAVGNQSRALGRVWWRRTAAAMTTLTTTSGAAVSSFTWSGTVFGAGDTFVHSSYRITNNGDNTFNVFQVGVILGGGKWSFIYDEESETIVKKWNTTFQTSANVDLEAAFDVTRSREIFNSAGDAWTFATASTDYYNHRSGTNIHAGWYDYIGDGKWAGYKEEHATPT